MVLWAALLAVALSIPSLWTGLQTEDWVFRDVARNAEDVRVPDRINLFGHRVARDGDTVFGHNQLERQLGAQPWIAAPRFHVSFWRPLTSITHLIDYRAWPQATAWMHAQNVVLYGVLVGVVALFLRRVLGAPWWVGLAALLYAIDDAHGHAVGWLANRNALVGAIFAIAAVSLHDRWRRGGSRGAGAAAPACLALGLAGSEIALGAVGYLLAHAIFLDPAPPSRRWAAAAPWVAVTVAWGVAYRALGHGAHGSGAYLDPLVDPTAFALEAPRRVLALLAGQLAGPPSDVWSSWPPAALWLPVIGCGCAVVVAWAAWRRVAEHRGLACVAVGGLLSLAPASAALPEDRLLLVAGVGGSAVVARLVAAALDREQGHDASRLRILGLLLLLVHAVVAPIAFPYRLFTMERYERRLRSASVSAYSQVTHMSQALVVVNAPDFYFGAMMVMSRIARREQLAHSTTLLVGSLGETRLTGVDQNAVDVRPVGGFLTSPFNRIYRGRQDALSVGDIIRYPGVEIRILDLTPDGEPAAARFRFEMALQDPRMRWMVHSEGRYLPVDPPEPGQVVTVGARP